ncbi:Concanavalin A-like lectin/glucanase, subgroup [Artemisia annua]|uniref:Concanavalin A-like lectin/glucanase, subgroup n=1 Tax=Artemisia annua TaxID=35608 RepID=A0A2U1MZ68_ARTAN|nr:Concanavalin A-like lectin/glucanase, subgroup [Artemisia annua]
MDYMCPVPSGSNGPSGSPSGSSKRSSVSGGMVAGILFGVLVFYAIVFFVVYTCCVKKRHQKFGRVENLEIGLNAYEEDGCSGGVVMWWLEIMVMDIGRCMCDEDDI